MRFQTAGVFLLSLLFTACSGAGGIRVDDAQEAFDRGMLEYEEGNYLRASEYFRAVFDFGRSSDIADEAQIYLAKSLFEDEQYLLAASEFTRFVDLYPSDSRIEEIEYERIRCYYELSPEYHLDQSDAERAIAYIRLFMARYPSSVYLDDLQQMHDELNEKLARKKFAAGQLYERRELFEAAAISYEQLLAEHPTSPLADDALLGTLRAKVRFAEASVLDRQEERYQEALDAYDRLLQLFPSSPLLPEAELMYDRAYDGLQRVQGQ
ncbi:MAG: outer membrane protein assembly factor BamD [Rubricoccaceae bacterium]|nr:outer membrane protein assembly factor BamD [Rubricoccaceae bacterium]